MLQLQAWPNLLHVSQYGCIGCVRRRKGRKRTGKKVADNEAAATNIVRTCGPVETWTKAQRQKFLSCKGVKKVGTLMDQAELQRLVKHLVYTQQN